MSNKPEDQNLCARIDEILKAQVVSYNTLANSNKVDIAQLNAKGDLIVALKNQQRKSCLFGLLKRGEM